MKAIDFHIHTEPDPNKDTPFTFSQGWLDKYVENSALDAIAITNHNLFDKEQFLNIVTRTQCDVFPGMEVSLDEGHVLIISNNTEDVLAEFSHASSSISQLNLGASTGISIDQFITFFPSWKNSILAFEISKSNSMRIPNALRDAVCVGGVSSSNRFQRELALGSEVPVLFSDSHASEDEPNSKRSDIVSLYPKHTFIECDTTEFEDIKRALKQKKTVGVNPDLVRNVYDIMVDNSPLRVSTGLNLIVGRRGSGKTFLLNTISSSSDDNVYRLEQFDTASNREKFLNKQQQQKGERAYGNFIQKYQRTWDIINEAIIESSQNDTLGEYIDDLKKFAASFTSKNQAAKIQLFSAKPFEIVKYSRLELDLKNLKEIILSKSFWSHVNNKYKSSFIGAYEDLRSFLTNYAKESDEQKRINKLIARIQTETRRQSGIAEPPKIDLTTTFKKYLVGEKTNAFLKKLVFAKKKGRILKQEQFGEYRVVVRLKPFEDAKKFQKEMHTNEGVKKDLIDPYNNYNFVQYFEHLKGHSFFRQDHLSDFIAHIETSLETANGTKASGGQEVAFALLMALEEAKNSDIALIDEPEASLDNYFIRTTLIPKIRELSEHTTTFVITHNSTLGTLLNPNYLIVAKNDAPNAFSYLSGDFKSARLRDFTGKDFPSVGKFVDAMESGIETYEKKGEIYESLECESSKAGHHN
ncbi:AAA family ATPase [Lacticaseibacillus suilingensis]|uniref:AAA family ATPase n=1 Tax=Lacticaseibacillus suilingensis TaxID=2799577 RepID=A0ABW4BI86_9LACO|nr:AAA family ATPase [Lacticaseibacillus suilingensis]